MPNYGKQVSDKGGRPRQYRGSAALEKLLGCTTLTAAQRLRLVTRDGPTWAPWTTFLKGLEGEPLTETERATWDQHANLPPRDGKGFPEAVCLVGRRAGKSTIAATLAVNAAVNADPQGHGGLHVVLAAQTESHARRILFGMAQNIVENTPSLAARLTQQPTRGEMVFDSARLITVPCVPSALRGFSAPVIIADELGFFGIEESVEFIRAARPCLATCPGSRLVIISSPGPAAGALYDMVESPGPDTLVWKASADAMNPSLPSDYMERMRIDDPIGYRQEVLAEFVSGVSTLLDPEKIDACARDYKELPPQAGTAYHAFVDPSGGRHDSMTLAIGHTDEEGRAVIDVLRRIEPPFRPADVVAEFAEVCKAYGCRSVEGDSYASALHADLWIEQGLQYQPCKFTRSQLYLAMVGPLAQEQVRYPRDKKLLDELRQLQRNKTKMGREAVDHPRSGSDDAANAVAGCVYQLLRRRSDRWETWFNMIDTHEEAWKKVTGEHAIEDSYVDLH